MRMGTSFPLFPHLFMVRGLTRRSSATSLTVSKSGRLVSFNFLFFGASSAIFVGV